MKIFFLILLFVFLISACLGYYLYTNKIDTISTFFSFENLPEPTQDAKTIKFKDNDTIEEEKDSVVFAFAGDVLLDRGVTNLIDQKGSDYILSSVKHHFDASDVTMVNLECPVSDKGTKEKDKTYTFRAKPKYLQTLTSGSIDIVSLANNHILDYGNEALLDTFQNLNNSHIKYAGAGTNIDHASQPVFMEINGLKIAILASSRVIPFTSWAAGKNKPGVATTYNSERILKEISSAREKADIVVVYLHWGEELKEQPVNHQKNLAKAYIDKGADMVIGSHPHVLEGLEYYKGKIIAYSLGNFVFTNLKNDSMILKIKASKSQIKNVQVIPCKIQSFRPIEIKDKAAANQLFSKIKALSFNVDINDQGMLTPKY